MIRAEKWANYNNVELFNRVTVRQECSDGICMHLHPKLDAVGEFLQDATGEIIVNEQICFYMF